MSQGGPLSSTGGGGGGGIPVQTLTGNSGGPVPPDPLFNNINVLGNNAVGINIVGNAGLNTLTVLGIPSTTTQIGVIEIATNAETLTGTDTTRAITPDDLRAKLGIQTIHGVAIGGGPTAALSWTAAGSTNQVLMSNGAAADPTYSTATYPPTTTINQILYSSAANTVSGLATANRAVLTTGTTGIPVLTPIAIDGQLIIGSTAGVPGAGTLTAGAGISILNGSNAITISSTTSSGGGLLWTDVTGATQTITAGNGYLANNAVVVAFSLPATGTIGDVFRIVGVQGSWTLSQAAGQRILFGSTATTLGAGGSLASANAGDCVECVATNTSASTIWRVMSSIGNITVV